ncbi:MAG: putative DNA binding domain-containing protein [Oscillospiraceae bacterium]|jgi:ATP-dependent DNA helicase RecG|nr:putative DNA binding domain-containing protein [Oscillospiraceae bacterium]
MQSEVLVKLVLEIRAQKCETQTLEVKAAHLGCPSKLFDTLSSFSNQDGGGIIIFGVDEKSDYEIVGVYDPQDLQHRVAEQCKQMQPSVRPLFSVAVMDGKTIVSAEIPGVDISERPVYYKGVGRVKGSFVRVGEADEPMTEYEIYSYDAYRRRVRDDMRISDLADVSQFNSETIEQYIVAVKKEKAHIAKLSDEQILNLMGVVKDGKPTLAGVLCFSAYPQAAFPQLCITAVVVPGLKVGDKGIDGERFAANKRIEGTIKEMVDEAVFFVERNMREKTIVVDGQRNDKPEYPINAVREAIVNAVMHRDYSTHTEGTPVRLLMFNDRLEIWNDGGLYGKITIDSLGKVHADTRNQVLANILEMQRVAEHRYSGIPTMRVEMAAFGLPEPIFENKRGNFVVTLKNNLNARPPENNIKAEGSSLVDFCQTPRTREEIAVFLGKTTYYAMRSFVDPLLENGSLKMTIPNKPRSRNQKYYSERL